MVTLENIILALLGIGALVWLMTTGLKASSSRGCGKRCGCSGKRLEPKD